MWLVGKRIYQVNNKSTRVTFMWTLFLNVVIVDVIVDMFLPITQPAFICSK